MILDIIIALAISAGVSLVITGLFHLRFRNSLFSKIRFNIAITFFLLTFALYLFSMIGISVWSASIIPALVLIVLFFLIRNAVGKLLKTDHRKSPQE